MCVTDDMEKFLTIAERQYIVKYELDSLCAQRDLRIPGLPDKYTLQHRDNICESLKDRRNSIEKYKSLLKLLQHKHVSYILCMVIIVL